MNLRSIALTVALGFGLTLIPSGSLHSAQRSVDPDPETLLAPADQEKLSAYTGYYDSMAELFPQMDETSRIELHLSVLEKRLRSKDLAGLSSEVRKNRAHVLDILHEYRLRGKFPQNTRFPYRTPEFIGDNGVVCAVGYLLERTAGREAVEAVSAQENEAYVMQMKNTLLGPWLAQVGLAKEEAAMIQPGYNWCLAFPPPTATPPPSNAVPCQRLFSPIQAQFLTANGPDRLTLVSTQVACAGCTTQMVEVTQLDGNGATLWQDHFSPPLSSDSALAMGLVAGGGGETYVMALHGYSTSAFTSTLLRYDNFGTLEWADVIPAGTMFFFGQGNNLARDPNGSLYMRVGPSLVKWDPVTRSQVWASAPITGGSDGQLVVDGQGHVYLAGSIYGSAGDYCMYYCAKKFDLMGVLDWTRTTLPAQSNWHQGAAVDGSGNFYMTGERGTVKYDPSGNLLWHSDHLAGSALAVQGNTIYVAGSIPYDFMGVEFGYRLVAYDLDGNFQWVVDTPHPTDWQTVAAIVADADGDVFVSGSMGTYHYSLGPCPPTNTPTTTLVPTGTPTPTWTRTSTATVTATSSPSSTDTSTPLPTDTLTPLSTATPTITLTPTRTSTPVPTGTATPSHTPVRPTCIFEPAPNPVIGGDKVDVCVRTVRPCRADCQVFSASYRKVRDFSKPLSGGEDCLSWDMRDESGERVSNGLYFMKVQLSGGEKMGKTLKVLVVR